MAEANQKGRYMCKIGFYDIYAKDTHKAKQDSKQKWGVGELVSTDYVVYHSKKLVSKGNKTKNSAIEKALELLGTKYKEIYSL
jgi:hypothetical protein